jgi:outer membrane autotransporter protein
MATSAFAASIDIPEFTQVYYGPSSYAINILGEELELPTLNLTDETLEIDTDAISSSGKYGYGVLFQYDGGELTDASATLANGSALNLSLATEESDSYLTGISIFGFEEAHLSLLEGSEIKVELQSVGYSRAVGIELGTITAPNTASVSLNEGSSVSVYAGIDVNTTSYNQAIAVGVALNDDVHAKVIMNNSSQISANADIYIDEDIDNTNVYADAIGIKADAEQVDVTLANGSQVSSEATIEFAETITSSTNSISRATGIAAQGTNVNLTLSDNSIINVYANNPESANAVGVKLYSRETANVALTEGSSTNTVASTTLLNSNSNNNGTSASATSVVLQNAKQGDVTLEAASSMRTEATAYNTSEVTGEYAYADAYADADGVNFENVDQGSVSLDGTSSINSLANATSDASEDVYTFTETSASGVMFRSAETVEVSLAGGSSISAEADAYNESAGYGNYGNHAYADATGIGASDSSITTVTLADNSSINAEATAHNTSSAEGNSQNHAEATSVSIRLSEVSDATITLSSGSTVNTGSVSTAIDSAKETNASSGSAGIIIDSGYGGVVEANLVDAAININTAATATQNGVAEYANDAEANVEGYGLAIFNATSAAIEITDTEITVDAEATATSTEGYSTAGTEGNIFNSSIDRITGLLVDGVESLSSPITIAGSSISVTATVTAGDEAYASANAIGLSDTTGAIALQLTDSTIEVSATAGTTADDSTSGAAAVGIYVDNVGNGSYITLDNSTVIVSADAVDGGAVGIYTEDGEYTIDLSNNSHLSASQVTEMSIESTAIYVADANAEITIDATSSLYGEWAIYSDTSNVSVENSGLISGRLQVQQLVNTADGVLEADFSDNDFVYSGSDDTDSLGYYFIASEATLYDNSTFQLIFSDNSGLTEIGDSISYKLLTTDNGSWNLDEIQLISAGNSPMLTLDWNEDSDANHLIATLSFLTPEEAGLSSNGTAAFYAAMADDLFNFDTDPDEWSPNVSGAFITGMTQSISTSQVNIGNRMGALMGMNSGDEVTASNGMWFSVRSTEAEQDTRYGISGFDSDTTGISLGFDREVGNIILGIAYTHGTTDTVVNDNSTDFDMTDNLFSLYGSYNGNRWYSEAILSAGFGNVDGTRLVGSDLYESDYDSNSYNAKIEMGMKFDQQGWQINPLFTLQYSAKEYDSYTETGGGDLALHVQSANYHTFTAGLGATVQKEFLRSWGSLTPEVSGSINYDLENDRIVSTANFVGGSTSFVAEGIEPSETSWDLGAALTIASLAEQNVSFRLGYDYSGREDFEAHSFVGKIRFEF